MVCWIYSQYAKTLRRHMSSSLCVKIVQQILCWLITEKTWEDRQKIWIILYHVNMTDSWCFKLKRLLGQFDLRSPGSLSTEGTGCCPGATGKLNVFQIYVSKIILDIAATSFTCILLMSNCSWCTLNCWLICLLCISWFQPYFMFAFSSRYM